jgi:beta-lactam-binding protein with PASTA domain
MQLLHYLKSKLFIRTIITILLVVVVGIFLLNRFLSYKTNHNQKIEVPNLAKMGLENAEKTLKEADLSFVVIDSASFNPEFPPKSVLDQNPEAGDFVKEGRKIYLTLNPSSYRKIEVPDVLGRTKRQVVTQLTSAGFKIGKSTYIPDIGRNVVRKLEYNGAELKIGTAIPKNSTIDLVLGDGKKSSNSDDSDS